MTYPHQMNCSHSDVGWCLDCVNKLGTEMLELEQGFAALEKWNHYFGFVRLYRCVGCWAVSNKTDEGIGGCDPSIVAEGSTPKEALIAAAAFLRDPKIPASIACPGCGKPLVVDEYRHNCRSERMRLMFRCSGCWNSYMGDDICPDCLGNLEVIGEDEDPRKPKPMWEAKCEKCGKTFVRGSIYREDEMVFPKWKFETLDLEGLLEECDDDEESD